MIISKGGGGGRWRGVGFPPSTDFFLGGGGVFFCLPV